MKLIQFNMFGAEPTTIRTYSTRDTQPHDAKAWHASLNGQYEIATAQRRQAEDVKANDSQTEPVI